MKNDLIDEEYYNGILRFIDKSEDKGELRKMVEELLECVTEEENNTKNPLMIGWEYDFKVGSDIKSGRVLGKNKEKFVALFDEFSLLVDSDMVHDNEYLRGENEWKRFSKNDLRH